MKSAPTDSTDPGHGLIDRQEIRHQHIPFNAHPGCRKLPPLRGIPTWASAIWAQDMRRVLQGIVVNHARQQALDPLRGLANAIFVNRNVFRR